MLILNIVKLTKDTIVSLKYRRRSEKLKIFHLKHKYVHNNLDKVIIELINLLNSLGIVYLYLYKYTSLKQKILLSTNYPRSHYIHKLKIIAALTSNYYIYNSFSSGMFSNWGLLKKKLVIYKWLKYFFLTKLIAENIGKNIFYKNYNLYILYLKLKLKYNGLKNIHTCPPTAIFITTWNNKFLREALKLKKNIIIINEKSSDSGIFPNTVIINTINKNFSIINFILEIIGTALFHGLL